MKCCSKPIGRIIKVAEFEAGLVGLDNALQNVYISGEASEEKIMAALLEWIRGFGNYISPSREEDYKKALLREYKAWVESAEGQAEGGRDETHE